MFYSINLHPFHILIYLGTFCVRASLGKNITVNTGDSWVELR